MGAGPPPAGARPLDEHHPARVPYERLGGAPDAPLWLRTDIPMARGLGFSGAVRVAAAGLAAAERGDPIEAAADEILAVTTELEGHGDNVAASLHGGVVAHVDEHAIAFPLGPRLSAARFVAWVPAVTTSTERSRRSLPTSVERADAVHNVARAAQFVLAFAHDDPALLVGATDDRLHQAARLAAVPGAEAALSAGVDAGAWCGWLSGSGPTVGFLCSSEAEPVVVAALGAVVDTVADAAAAHVKVLSIDAAGLAVAS
jgi:homoserine kinase